ncbi:hypothetical protein niasHS_008405 [Heterodera schachtii]|uniref:Secreted protein n=1 Tax=Heterodera schachtii TaxID=97005 RepID=A0ABD2J4G7_HETSC
MPPAMIRCPTKTLCAILCALGRSQLWTKSRNKIGRSLTTSSAAGGAANSSSSSSCAVEVLKAEETDSEGG